MDKIDRKILAILKRNARLTASAISDEIDLSVSAVIERIKKMESNNTIIGYTVSVDNKIIGNSLGNQRRHRPYHTDISLRIGNAPADCHA